MDRVLQKKYAIIFSELSAQIIKFGIGKVCYTLTFGLEEPLFIKRHQSIDLNLIFKNINEVIRERGIDYVIFNLNSKLYIKNFVENSIDKKTINDKIIETVLNTYETDLETICQSVKRDKSRVFASGTIFKLMADFTDTKDYDIQKIVPKHKITISKQKGKITYLDHTHKLEKEILDNYLKIKETIIKDILNEREN